MAENQRDGLDKVFGNECAHGLAQQATKTGQRIERNLHEFPLIKSIVSRHIAQLDKKEILALTLGSNSKVGAFTKSTDKALPSHHTSSLLFCITENPKPKQASYIENRDCAPE